MLDDQDFERLRSIKEKNDLNVFYRALIFIFRFIKDVINYFFNFQESQILPQSLYSETELEGLLKELNEALSQIEPQNAQQTKLLDSIKTLRLNDIEKSSNQLKAVNAFNTFHAFVSACVTVHKESLQLLCKSLIYLLMRKIDTNKKPIQYVSFFLATPLECVHPVSNNNDLQKYWNGKLETTIQKYTVDQLNELTIHLFTEGQKPKEDKAHRAFLITFSDDLVIKLCDQYNSIHQYLNNTGKHSDEFKNSVVKLSKNAEFKDKISIIKKIPLKNLITEERRYVTDIEACVNHNNFTKIKTFNYLLRISGLGIHQLNTNNPIEENKHPNSNERLAFLSFFNNQSKGNPSSGHTTPENHSSSDDESPSRGPN